MELQFQCLGLLRSVYSFIYHLIMVHNLNRFHWSNSLYINPVETLSACFMSIECHFQAYAFSIMILFSSCRTFTKSPFLILRLIAYCFGRTRLNDCSPTRPWILRYRFCELSAFSVLSRSLEFFILCTIHDLYKELGGKMMLWFTPF